MPDDLLELRHNVIRARILLFGFKFRNGAKKPKPIIHKEQCHRLTDSNQEELTIVLYKQRITSQVLQCTC